MLQLPLALVFLGLQQALPALAQWEPTGGPNGDFRAADRPITAPALGAMDAAGLSSSSDSMKLLEGIGPKSPATVLKRLDADLGKPPTGEFPPGRPGDYHKAGEHLDKQSAAPTTFK